MWRTLRCNRPALLALLVCAALVVCAPVGASAATDDDIPGVALAASPVAGTLDAASDPHDVFAIPLLAGQRILVNVSGAEGTDFDIRLFAPGATGLDSNTPVAYSDYAEYPDEFEFTAATGGVHYLDVSAFSGAGAYSLTYSVTALGVDDDIPGSAAAGSPLSGSLDAVADRDDVYAIHLDTGQSFDATLTGAPAGDFDLYLYRPGAGSIVTTDPVCSGTSDTYPEPIRFVASHSGIHYLRIHASVGAGAYSVDYSKSELGSDDDIPGIVIPPGPLSGTLDDAADLHDVYAIDLTVGERLMLDVGSSRGECGFRVLGPSLPALPLPPSGVTAPGTLEYIALSTGTHFVDVYSIAGGASACDYSVGYRVVAISADDEVPGVDVSESPVLGELALPDDPRDVYSVRLEVGQRIEASIAHAPDVDFDLSLYAPGVSSVASASVAAAHSATSPDAFTYDASTSGTYSLSAAAVSGSGDYQLTYAVATPSRVRGTVVGAGGVRVPGIDVTAYSWDAGEGTWAPMATASTDESGTYSIVGLPTGSYRVGFTDPAGEYFSEYYDAATGVETAMSVTVVEGIVTSDIGASLVRGARILGTVHRPAGSSAGIAVTAYRWDAGEQYWEAAAHASADESGAYRVDGLVAGVYRVGFSDPEGVCAPEYYDDVRQLTEAKDLTLAVGAVESVDATLAAAGSISGVVTDSDGVIEGIDVTAYVFDAASDNWVSAQWARTDVAGRYRLLGLPVGTYRVGFSDSGGLYAPEQYPDAALMSMGWDVIVDAESVTDGIDVSLSRTASISGAITSVDGAVADVDVAAYSWSDEDGSWVVAGRAWSDDAGDYSLSGLRPGAYRIGFDGASCGYESEFYDNAERLSDARDVSAAEGTTTAGVDASMVRLGRISGTVTASFGTMGARVTAYTLDEQSGCWTSVAGATAGMFGEYEIADLPAGTYRVGFDDPEGRFCESYFADADSIDAARDVVVSPGETAVGVDAVLIVKGSVTGVVRGPDGVLEGIQVTASEYDSDRDTWEPVARATTDAGGGYSLTAAPGGVRIECLDPTGEYAPFTYGEEIDPDTYTLVIINAGLINPGHDMLLTPAGHLSGTVHGVAGGLPDINVTLYVHEEFVDLWSACATTKSEADGSYALDGLRPGIYRLGYSDASGAYVDGAYGGAETVYGPEALDVGLSPGQTRASLDVTLTQACWITGTVRGPDGPLEGIRVTADQQPIDEMGELVESDSAFTAADGTYRIGRLRPGIWNVRFGDDAGVHTSESVSGVSVEQGDPATVDVTLSPAGGLSGTITGPAGAAESIDVALLAWSDESESWDTVQSSTTDSDGTYAFLGVPVGVYRLRFWDPHTSAMFCAEYYDDASTAESSTPVPVVAGRIRQGVDAELAEAGHIVGTVRDYTGALDFIAVTAFTQSPASGEWAFASEAYTRPDGTYDIGGLGTGDYRVLFQDPTGVRAGEYYLDAALPDAATLVSVEAGGIAGGVDATLDPDMEAPDTTATAKPSTWTSGSVSVWFDYSDDSMLEYGEWTRYSINGGPFTYILHDNDIVVPDPEYAAAELWNEFAYVDVEGVSTVSYQSLDHAGHLEDIKAIEVKIDRTAPVITCNPAATYTSTASFGVTASDAGGSGVASISCRIDGGVTQTVNSGSATVTSSSLGSHTIVLWSKDKVGNTSAPITRTFSVVSPPPPPPPPSTFATTISLGSSTTKPAYGAAVTLSASLSRSGGGAVSGASVVFERQSGSTWVSVGSSTTDSSGRAKVSTRPYGAARTVYRVRFAGSGENLASTSSAVVVVPKAYLSAPVAPTSAYRSRGFSVYGYLKPRHTAGTSPVRIYKERYVSNKWVVSGYVNAKAYNYSSYTKYVASISLPYKGMWRLRAYHADAGHTAVYSGYDYITVK